MLRPKDSSTQTGMELLRGYVDTALFRDVVERHAISNPRGDSLDGARRPAEECCRTLSIAEVYSVVLQITGHCRRQAPARLCRPPGGHLVIRTLPIGAGLENAAPW